MDTDVMLRGLKRISELKGTLPSYDREVVGMAYVWICTHLEQRPHVLTDEELAALPYGAVVWEENRFVSDTPLEQLVDANSEEEDVLCPMMRDNTPPRQAGIRNDFPKLANMDGQTVNIANTMFGPFEAGFQSRYWSAKPSTKDREEMPWA